MAQGGIPLKKKYFVRLSDEKHDVCQDIAKRLKEMSEKVNRAALRKTPDATIFA